jgi:PAS domain S-box-containing protein
MNDEGRNREELISELRQLRQRVKKIEYSVGKGRTGTMSDEKAKPSNIDRAVVFDSKAFQKMFKDHGSIMYVVDLSTFLIVDANKAALEFYGYNIETMLTKRIPDINTTPEPEIRAEIKRAIHEGRSYYVYKHQLANGEIRDVEIYANPISIQGKKYSFSVVHDITEHKKVDEDREHLITELRSALEEIKTLRGILPICSFCKKIRDDKGFWNQVEVYIKEHSEVDFSHSMCPECGLKHYPEFFNT